MVQPQLEVREISARRFTLPAIDEVLSLLWLISESAPNREFSLTFMEAIPGTTAILNQYLYNFP